MADASPSFNRDRKSGARGFRRASAAAPGALKKAGAKRGFAEARLLTDWREVVGAELAAICHPVKISYRRADAGLGATLVLAVTAGRAPEVDMARPRIIEMVNACYGYRAVSRVTIDQSRDHVPAKRPAPRGMAEDAAPWEGPPRAPLRVEGVEDEGLRDALGRLGTYIAARSARQTDT